jgi:hypothetical protein
MLVDSVMPKEQEAQSIKELERILRIQAATRYQAQPAFRRINSRKPRYGILRVSKSVRKFITM